MAKDLEQRLQSIRKLSRADRLREVEQLAESPEAVALILLACLLDDPSSDVRERAVVALGRLGGTLPLVAVRGALGDPEWLVRNAAAEALGEIGNARDTHRLLDASRDRSWVVRSSAASSFGTRGGAVAKRRLLRLLAADPEPTVRRQAARALAAVQDPGAVQELEASLAREVDPKVHTGLLWALYILGQHQRLPALIALLRNEDPRVRHQVLNGIPDDISPDDSQRMTTAIESLLKDEGHAGVRSTAGAALTRLRHPTGATE